jgi:hypothetical protein
MNTRNIRRGRLPAIVAAGLLAMAAAPTHVLAQGAGSSGWGDYIGAAVGEPEFGDLGVKVFGGQQFHRHIGWEAGLTRFFEDEVRGPFGTTRTDFWGVSGAVLGILPLPNAFSVYGKLGVMYGRKRIRDGGGDRTDGEFNPLIGIGGRYEITPRAAARLEFEEFDQGNLLSVGVTYRF